MTHSKLSRRSVLALAVAGLAGCAGSDGDDESGPSDAGADGETETASDRESAVPDRDVEPDWESAAAFRTWLRFDAPVEGGNRRFDYTGVFPPDVDLGNVLPGFSDVETDDVDGHLVQSFTQVFFGSFDPETLAADASGADGAELVDEYEGYMVIDEDLPSGETRTLAAGPDAIVVGDDYEARIDARLGEGERLEDADPEFTHLFQQLPHETTVTGQYDAPAGGVVDADDIYLWGVSSESPMAEEMTWVFVMESADALTEDVLAELEAVSGSVTESSMDGRTATITGAPPEMGSDAGSGAAGNETDATASIDLRPS